MGIQRRELNKYGGEERLLGREERWNTESDLKKKRMPIFISGLTIEKRYKVGVGGVDLGLGLTY